MFRRPVMALLVLLFPLLVTNRSLGAFVVRHEATSAAPSATTTIVEEDEVATEYKGLKERLNTRDYKFYNFDHPARVFDMQRRTASDLAKIGALCAMTGVAGALISEGFNLESWVTYTALGVAFVGVVLIVIGVTHMPKKKGGFAVTSPKNNELGIAYNF